MHDSAFPVRSTAEMSLGFNEGTVCDRNGRGDGDAAAGSRRGALFKAKCAGCHGADGTKSIAAMGVKPINTEAVKSKGADALAGTVTNGSGKMPAFKGKLGADEIAAVVQYVLSLK